MSNRKKTFKQATVTAKKLRIREKASLNSEVLSIAKQGTKYVVSRFVGRDWVKIVLPVPTDKGLTEAYCRKEFVTIEEIEFGADLNNGE